MMLLLFLNVKTDLTAVIAAGIKQRSIFLQIGNKLKELMFTIVIVPFTPCPGNGLNLTCATSISIISRLKFHAAHLVHQYYWQLLIGSAAWLWLEP